MAKEGPRLEVFRGDITTLDVDAIVNAANSALRPGGGVCGAIHRAAGPKLAEACAAVGGCPTGDARATEGFRLRAKWVTLDRLSGHLDRRLRLSLASRRQGCRGCGAGFSGAQPCGAIGSS